MLLTRLTLTFVTALALSFTVAPFAEPASASPYCSGGNPDTTATQVADGYYASTADRSVYRDTNNLTGIQRTATTCSEYVDGKWVSWTIAADEKVAGAPGVPGGGLPGGCQLRPPHIWCPI